MTQTLSGYDYLRSYDWNYEHVPDPVDVDVPEVPGAWDYCGLPVNSPLGMPAGPLLNGQWILYYASLGFDVLTYKTVRSSYRACYPLPNLQPVDCGQLMPQKNSVPAIEDMRGSWAVSFGMPSKDPDTWREDVEFTRSKMGNGQVLVVSVVGTIQEGWAIEDLAEDYANCARWAVDSGAQCIEMNFSCPNVSTCDGQLFQQPKDAAIVAAAVRERVGKVPCIIKIGFIENDQAAMPFLEAVHSHVDALALTNSIPATVRQAGGPLLFDGQRRGICGDAVRSASIRQTRLLSRLIDEHGLDLRLIGVGGASTAKHVSEYLEAGASHVQLASAAMTDPGVALKIRSRLAAHTVA